MSDKQKILNRVTLLMNYDSSKTLNENKEDLNIIDEARYGMGGKNLEVFLKELRGADAAALRKAVEILETEGKPILRADERAANGFSKVKSNEILQALGDGEIVGAELGKLESALLRHPESLTRETKEFLLKDLTTNRGFRTKFLNSSREDIIKTLTTKTDKFTPYSPEQAAEIADRYVAERAKRMGPTVEPKTAETAAEKEIIEKTVQETRPEILKRFSKAYKIYRVAKGALTFALVAGAAGLIWFVIAKMHGPDAIPVDENGDVIGEDPNAIYNPSAYDPSPYDTASTETTTAPPAETDRRNQVAPQQAPTSSLSLTNIANDINKPQQSYGDPNAVSPEMRSSLINRIQNDKRYKGEDLEPNERAFVDQYIRSMSSRLPSKEKIKYQMSKPLKGKAPASEPVAQDIKYGYKQ